MRFNSYDDPKRAAGIWKTYITARTPESKIKEAEEAAAICRKAEDLDIILDRVTTGHSTIHICGGLASPVDIDSNGGYSNAVKALEN